MIIVGLIQNKKAQTGLSALNGGNEDLFVNTKERGLEKTLSIIMLTFGSILFTASLIIIIFTNIFISS